MSEQQMTPSKSAESLKEKTRDNALEKAAAEFADDATEKDETGACLARGDVSDIDFLKVGHHGSEVSLTPDEAAALDPEVSVASAGEGNKYGHPRKECMDVLSGAGSVFLCTKDVGTVTVKPGARGPMVFTERTPGGGAAALASGL